MKVRTHGHTGTRAHRKYIKEMCVRSGEYDEIERGAAAEERTPALGVESAEYSN